MRRIRVLCVILMITLCSCGRIKEPSASEPSAEVSVEISVTTGEESVSEQESSREEMSSKEQAGSEESLVTPSPLPTASPSVSDPTAEPEVTPTAKPTTKPTAAPTKAPTAPPVATATAIPTAVPVTTPAPQATPKPVATPSPHEHNYTKVYWYGKASCDTETNFYNLQCTICGKAGGSGTDVIPHTPVSQTSESKDGCIVYLVTETTCSSCGRFLDRTTEPLREEHTWVTGQGSPVWEESTHSFVYPEITYCSICFQEKGGEG